MRTSIPVLPLALLTVLACADDSPAEPRLPASVAVTPSSVLLESFGEEAGLTAEVFDAAGRRLDAPIVWTSSAGEVAPVDSGGRVVAVLNGQASILATAGAASGTAEVTVAQRTASITWRSDPVVFDAVGESTGIIADAKDARGHSIPGWWGVYSSEDVGVVTVNGDGVVRSVDSGRTVLAIALDGVSAVLPAEVRAGEWAPRPAAGLARSDAAAATVALDGRLYVLGGLSGAGSGSPVAAVERFDPSTDSWSALAPLPLPTWGSAAVAHAGKLYLFGGFTSADPFPFGPTDRAFSYDPALDQWSEIAPLPSARGGAGAESSGGLVHVLGGSAAGVTDDHSVYDPAADAWSAGPLLPTARTAFASAALPGGLILVAGGRGSPADDIGLASVDLYDPATGAWSAAAPLPAPRFGLASAAAGGSIYVLGGTPTTDVFSRVLAYRPAQDAWAQMADLREPLTLLGAAPLADGIHVVGGASEASAGERTANHWIFVPPG
ncbi:MAG: kelch repeat-containing protein [Gemmatimonadota bacterium]